ncbi:MAG: gliding motility-associated C-terminal domain-containing protein [Bacteroidia bacterium]|nr:gliding motility-associated C-terminal domain-containing protein [Bacteroidia bacterium]
MQLKATHIVGGDFYYQYLGNDDYRITMKLYIDCANGNKDAIESDLTASIGFFDGKSGDYLFAKEITRTGPIHLTGVPYKCIENTGSVCVDQYNYIFEINLPKRKDGYIISFQRCCRNNTIKNIENPSGTGATYWVKIPDRYVYGDDNSPIFKQFPPIYICKQIPLVFDHSAKDADGDSLSYELYQPYLGANKDSPKPNIPSNPPYTKLNWSSGFSTGNPMWGNPSLAIDPETGELTVTPSINGQFVIGIKVKQWRKGVLIGETLRDYQFNVLDCKAVVVSYFKPVTSCSDTVFFNNKSIGATSYEWDFGDPASGFTNNKSNLKNPKHIFSKGGDYYVKLKAWNSACVDEYTIKVKVRIKKGFDLGKNITYCNKFKHQLSVPWNDFNMITWSTGENTTYISITDTGKYWVEAVYGLCILRDTIKIGYEPVSFDPPKDSMICDYLNTTLELKNVSKNSRIMWSTGDTIAKTVVTNEGKYTVRVFNSYCEKNDTVEISIAKIKPYLGDDIFVCNDFLITLDAGKIQNGASYKWHDGSIDRTYTTNTPGKYWVTTTLKHCKKSDTLTISNSTVDVELGFDKNFCDSVNIKVDAGLPRPGTTRTYLWSNGETGQKTLIKSKGKHWVRVTDNYGCFNSDTIRFFLTFSPKINLGNDTVICLRSPIYISPGKGFSSYQWNNGSKDDVLKVENDGVYYVTVVDEAGCKATDSIKVMTDPNRLPNDIFVPNAFTPNDDGLNDLFPFTTPVLHSNYNLKIFDRWGEKIYDSEYNHDPWNGETKNKNDQIDAYIWVVSYKGCDGNHKSNKGTITIIR